ASAIEHVRAGRLRALGVTTTTRSEVLPDIPTIADFVPGYEASGIGGVGAPRNTPVEIINKLNREINAILATPPMNAPLAHLGATPVTGSPEEFRRLLTEEVEKWGKVVKFSGAKPD